MAGVSYAAPWWVSLLHRLPHFDLRWEATSSQFRPEDTDYQQSELDIMFNLDKVHIILDEMLLNGCIVETNRARILAPLLILDKMSES